MAKNYDDVGGIWRTIGGRRVFIKTGQDLASAMRESGKFKNNFKKSKIGDKRDKKYDDYLDKYKDKSEGELRRIIYESNDEVEKMSAKKLLDNMKDEDKNIAKAMKESEKFKNLKNEDYQKQEQIVHEAKSEVNRLERRLSLLEDNDTYESPDYDETKYALQDAEDRYREEKAKYDKMISKRNHEEYLKNYDYEKNMPEGAKFNKMLEDNKVRTFAELQAEKNKIAIDEKEFKDFEDEYNYYADDTEDKSYRASRDKLEDAYRQMKKNGYVVVNGYQINDKQVGTFADDIKEREQEENKYIEYYKKENLGKPSNYKAGDKVEFDDGYYDIIKGTILREATDKEKKYNINSNLKGYIIRDKYGFEYIVPDTRIKKETSYETYLRDTQGTTNEKIINAGREKENRVDYQKYKNEVIRNINQKRMEKGTTSLNQAYKKAFEEYKKLHPNTKLNLKDFIKMSEE